MPLLTSCEEELYCSGMLRFQCLALSTDLLRLFVKGLCGIMLLLVQVEQVILNRLGYAVVGKLLAHGRWVPGAEECEEADVRCCACRLSIARRCSSRVALRSASNS